MDLTHQSHTLDLALKASRARRFAPIRLLVNDIGRAGQSIIHGLLLTNNRMGGVRLALEAFKAGSKVWG